jgi:hypothetical protein
MTGDIRHRLVRRPVAPCNFGDEYRQLGIYAKRYN